MAGVLFWLAGVFCWLSGVLFWLAGISSFLLEILHGWLESFLAAAQSSPKRRTERMLSPQVSLSLSRPLLASWATPASQPAPQLSRHLLS